MEYGKLGNTDIEYEEISKGIVNCEQSIFENFVMPHMYVGEE